MYMRYILLCDMIMTLNFMDNLPISTVLKWNVKEKLTWERSLGQTEPRSLNFDCKIYEERWKINCNRFRHFELNYPWKWSPSIHGFTKTQRSEQIRMAHQSANVSKVVRSIFKISYTKKKYSSIFLIYYTCLCFLNIPIQNSGNLTFFFKRIQVHKQKSWSQFLFSSCAKNSNVQFLKLTMKLSKMYQILRCWDVTDWHA